MKNYFAIILLIISSIVSPLSSFANTYKKPKGSDSKNAETTLNYDNTKSLFENNEKIATKRPPPLEKPVPTTNNFTNSYFYLDAINSNTAIMAIKCSDPLKAPLYSSSIGYRYQENHHGFEIGVGFPRVNISFLYYQNKKPETFYFGLGIGICYISPGYLISVKHNVMPYPKVFLGYQWKKKGQVGSYIQLDILTMPTISYGICF